MIHPGYDFDYPIDFHERAKRQRKLILIIASTGQLLRIIKHHLRRFARFGTILNRAKHPWRSVNIRKVAGWSLHFTTKSNAPPWVFFKFLKLHKWYQFAQSIKFGALSFNFKSIYGSSFINLYIQFSL